MAEDRIDKLMVQALLALAVGFVAVHALCDARADEAQSEAAKSLIAMVEATSPEAPMVGAAIIVGRRGDRLYLVTADHLAFPFGKPADEIEVQFRFLPGETKLATALDTRDRNMDLAVLLVRGADDFAGPLSKLSFERLGDVERDHEQVYAVGNPHGERWYANITPYFVRTVEGDEIVFEGRNVTVGHSGGGLFDMDHRLVGMVKTHDQLQSRALRMDRIIGKLRRWGYPVALQRGPGQKSAKPAPSVPHKEPALRPLEWEPETVAFPTGRPIKPSFDCSKARTPNERLICADADLADADRQMGDLYFALRRGLEGDRAAKQRLVDAQRKWIKSRNRACPSSEYDLMQPELARAATKCLLSQTLARYRALSRSH